MLGIFWPRHVAGHFVILLLPSVCGRGGSFTSARFIRSLDPGLDLVGILNRKRGDIGLVEGLNERKTTKARLLSFRASGRSNWSIRHGRVKQSTTSSMSALATSAPRSVGKLVAGKTVFFACDIQERFRYIIYNMPGVISTGRYMLDVAKELDIPCVVTEQYPKALLHTVPELNVGSNFTAYNVSVFAKKLFSMCTDEVLDHVNSLPNKPTDVVLFGIEAHVCVTQTCLDLLEKGYGVHIICDGVSSQREYSRSIALQRMQQVGAFLTSAEQVTFQLMGSADHPRFKQVSALGKKRTHSAWAAL